MHRTRPPLHPPESRTQHHRDLARQEHGHPSQPIAVVATSPGWSAGANFPGLLTLPLGQAAACLPWRSQRSRSQEDQRTRGPESGGAKWQGAFVGRLCQRT
jgi:hypothetical protein